MSCNKGVWRVVHQRKKFLRFFNDGGAVTPSENRGKEGCNFDVLFAAEKMRYGYGVGAYKKRLIVLLSLFV